MLAKVDELGAERDRLVRETRVKYAGTDKYVLGPQMRIGKKRLRAHVCSWHKADVPAALMNVRS
jgi:hypothetical protein